MAGAAAGGAQRVDGGGSRSMFVCSVCASYLLSTRRATAESFSGKADRLALGVAIVRQNPELLVPSLEFKPWLFLANQRPKV